MRLTGIAVLSVALALGGCGGTPSKVEGVCQVLLKQRLKAPSSLSIASTRSTEEEISAAEFVAYQNDRGAGKPINKPANYYRVVLEYDAQNSFGAMLRGVASCEYVETKDTSLEPNTFTVYLDGLNQHEYVEVESADILHITAPTPHRSMSEIRIALGDAH